MVKSSLANAGDVRDTGSIPGSERHLEASMVPTPIFLPGESHRRRSLEGYSPWGCTESDMTEVT